MEESDPLTDQSPSLDPEEAKRELQMEFGGNEVNTMTDARQISDDDMDDSDGDINQQDRDLAISVRDIAIMHMAKKNLSFELEYIQIVCQSLEQNGMGKNDHFSKKIIDENPLLALGGGNEGAGKGVRFAFDEEEKRPQKLDAAATKARIYLEKVYEKLNQMKKDYLKDESKLTREEMRKHLTAMACYIERTRLFLDNFIYPRDLSLNLIDIEIDEGSVVDKKRQMHLTERLYTIVYKDFFTAYQRAVLFNQKIKKYAGKDIEEAKPLMHTDTRISAALQNDILESDRESIQIASQDLEGNKMGKDAEDAKKHMTRKDGGHGSDIIGLKKILHGFNPHFKPFEVIDEIINDEFIFQLKFKSQLPQHTDIEMTLFEENSRPFSLTAVYDYEQSINQQNDTCFYFVNIPLRALVMCNLALIIKIIKKRPSKLPALSMSLLGGTDVSSMNKCYLGYTILPISKLFWVQLLKVRQLYDIKEAQVYKTMAPQLIEDKYATLIEKRGFKKYKDVALTQLFNISYTYKMDLKLKEDQIKKRGNSIIIKRANFFDSSMFFHKDDDTLNVMKHKVEKYRYNDLQIELNNFLLSEQFLKKSPILRVEVALRDNYGTVYEQVIYKTITQTIQNFPQTYESLIYPLETTEFKMNENFFVRIPTRTFDTLKRMYLLFKVQVLVNQKDARGNKYKSSNYFLDTQNLTFRTELVAALPLYDAKDKCILKNRLYSLDLLALEDPRRAIPSKFENFKQIPTVSNLRPTSEKMTVTVKLISNEFTHNTYINNLLLIKETSLHEFEVETILNELKKLKDSNDQILFHDKILDKLFQLMSNNKDGELSELIFETIIMMIDLFQSRYTDYKDILDNYIQDHFAQSKVYIALLHQIRKVSEKIKQGLTENAQNEQKNAYVLMTMKYLGIILKIVKNSYHEALQCKDQQSTTDPDASVKFGKEESKNGNQQQFYDQNNPAKFDMYKKSMIQEEQFEDSDEDDHDDGSQFSKNASRSGASVRKTAIRRTLKDAPVNIHEQPQDLSKRQFGAQIQKSLRNIFEGCHKDSMKTTLSLRAILYENITQIFEHITDYMDDQFMTSILNFIYEEQQVQIIGIGVTPTGGPSAPQQQPQPSSSKQEKTKGILKNTEEKKGKDGKTNPRRSEMQSVGGQMIMLDLNFFEQETNVKALQDYNWINEEAITKIKIIAMGRLLEQGVFEKVQGDTNKIVMSFCQNIEKYQIKRQELGLHVFYFLYALFQYLKSADEFSEIEEIQGAKLKIFSKRSLDMREFFAKILPDFSTIMKTLLKDANIEDRVREAKLPDDALNPFNEKASLVLMSILNTLTMDKFQYFIFNDHKKLLMVVKNLKKLTSKMAFSEPYQVFFEKKKIQVIRKIIMYIITIFMTKEPEHVPSDYHQSIHQCRLMMIFLWNKLAKMQQDFKKTTRAKTLVKDQLKVYKGKMLETFRDFWNKFKYLGQPWMAIKGSLSKQFQTFIKLSGDKAIKLYMEVISDTLQYEYKETKEIQNTCSSIFKVYYDLNMTFGKDQNAQKFYDTFEKIMIETNETYKSDQTFKEKVNHRFIQMKVLSNAIINVNYSKEHLKENTFYRAYCMAQLIEILWELKLFQLFLENQVQFEGLNKQLENNLEVAYTALRFVDSLEQQSEDDRIKIGQRDIVARIQLRNLQNVQSYFTKAEFYEKAIEILNKQKDIAENQLFDYSMVSMIVKSQYKIYKQLSQDQDRHFAIYFKIGFYGQSFPTMFKNKEFIYRGRKLMKRGDVKDRFIRFFPDAIVLEHSNQPDKATQLNEKKSIQIQKVDALTFVELKDFGMAEKSKDKEELELGRKARDLPPKLRAYYLENFKNKFYKQTMLESKNDDELQKDRLIEIFKVKNKFPTVYNMQEIIKVKKFVRHAIDEAVRNIQNIIEQIETFKKTAVQTEDANDFEFLTSQIRAALESPIQGGIEKFINTFITEVNLKGNQREKTLILFKKIEECNSVINDGIQAIQSFTNQETMFNKINGDYNNFKEKINKVRQYIDGKVM